MLHLEYKPHAADVVARLRQLYQRQAADQIFAAFKIPNPAWTSSLGTTARASASILNRRRVAFWDRYFAARADLEDDSIPAAYLSEIDQGLYGGMLGGEVRFMAHPENGWISSMVAPLLRDWADFGQLRIDRSAVWFQRYLQQLDTFVSGTRASSGSAISF